MHQVKYRQLEKIFITGADGLLGSNTVRELLNRNYTVKALIQKGSKSRTLEGLDIEFVEGDLLDKKGLVEHVKGCDAIIHIAALTNVWPIRHEIYYKVNVDGTMNLVEAALENKIKRFVFISSASAFGYGQKSSPGDETTPTMAKNFGLDYVDSKLLAQEKVLQAVQKQKLPAIIVNPTFMIGPYDSKPSSGAMILAVAKQELKMITTGGKNWVYVNDVAHAICNALTMGRIGEMYILGNENLSYKEATGIIAQAAGVKPPSLKVPSFLVKLAGRAGSLMGKISGKAPKISYPVAKISLIDQYYSVAKARKELNLPATPIQTAVEDAIQWFKENGYLNNGK